MTPVIAGLIRPKPFGFVCPTPTIIKSFTESSVNKDTNPKPYSSMT